MTSISPLDSTMVWGSVEHEMDLNSKSYASVSPNFATTMRHHTSSYPNTPQSGTHTEPMPIKSPAISGLGLFNCASQPNHTQLPISPSQSLLQPSPGWQHESSASHCFSNPPSNLVGYPSLSLYEDLDTISTSTSSPFVVPCSHMDTTASVRFLDTPQPIKRCHNTALQRSPIPHNTSSNYRVMSPSQSSPYGTVKREVEEDWERMAPGEGALKQTLAHVENLSTMYQEMNNSLCSRPKQNRDDMFLELPPSNIHNRTQQAPFVSSNSNTAVEVKGSNSTQANSVRRSTRKMVSLTNGKYECEKCGLQFTRSSNCRSHMKIHDPNRKYPHKCTVGQCMKQFSRKTDLVRHVDSVHKKLRKFGCDQCGHHFARQDTLRRHREDGCRRQHRIAQQHQQLTIPIVSVSLDSDATYPPVSVPFREQSSANHTHHQLHSPYMRSPFLDNGSDAYSQFA